MTTTHPLREEAEKAYEDMTYADWKCWVADYADGGNMISLNANTDDEIMEMFVQEYIEVNG